jgi:hypothetical protein
VAALLLGAADGEWQKGDMDSVNMRSESDLESLLESQGQQSVPWAAVTAARTAIRAVPFGILAAHDDHKVIDGLLPVFRFCIMSWAASYISTYDFSHRAYFASGKMLSDLPSGNSAFVATAKSAVEALEAAHYKRVWETESEFGHTVIYSATECLNYASSASRSIISKYQLPQYQSGMNDEALDAAESRVSKALFDAIGADSSWLSKHSDRPKAVRRLTARKLWPTEPPELWIDIWKESKRRLLENEHSENYAVWIDWYERRIRGERAAFDIPGDKYRKEDKKILRRLAEATDEDFWGKGHEYVNATLKTWLDEARVREAPPVVVEVSGIAMGSSMATAVAAAVEHEPLPSHIATVLQNQASPQAQIVDGKLDAAPNAVFDKPQYSDSLAELPSELLAFSEVILNSLPSNCQPVVRNCFTGFRDEMLVRGNRPILNIVKAMAASLTAELYGAPDPTTSPDEWQLKDPREWGAGMDSMFASFFKSYHDLIHHFPMDAEREEFIANTPIDEVAAIGAALTQPVDAVAELIKNLGKQGFATENIVRIIEAHQLYNRDVSQLPGPDQPTDAITPKRRHVLGTAGFYLQTYSVIGSSASIYSLPAFQELLPKLKDAIDALLGFIA